MDEINSLYKFFRNSTGVSTDTRTDVHGSIFFALSGESFDGNEFAAQAIKKGAVLAVIDNPDYNNGPEFFLVENVLKSLQGLAYHHRKEMNASVFAITGSNGKTTTKELISAVLSSAYEIISTTGNLNNHIGVPLTLLKIKKETEIAVVEMGANHIGEIGELCRVASPDAGMITNIGKAHLEGFGSYEGVIAAKSEMYEYLKKHNGHVVVNSDDSLLTKLSEGIDKTTYGKNNSDIEGELIRNNPSLIVEWGSSGKIFQCNSQLYGNYNFYNILAAISTGIYFKMAPEIINKAVSSYVSENNRSQLLKTRKNSIILDAYNANPYSLKEALLSFSEGNFKNPWILIGDMFELGSYSAEEHQRITDLIETLDIPNVILIGTEFSKTNNSFRKFISTREAHNFIKNEPILNANILIKGSRGMKMEDLTSSL